MRIEIIAEAPVSARRRYPGEVGGVAEGGGGSSGASGKLRRNSRITCLDSSGERASTRSTLRPWSSSIASSQSAKSSSKSRSPEFSSDIVVPQHHGREVHRARDVLVGDPGRGGQQPGTSRFPRRHRPTPGRQAPRQLSIARLNRNVNPRRVHGPGQGGEPGAAGVDRQTRRRAPPQSAALPLGRVPGGEATPDSPGRAFSRLNRGQPPAGPAPRRAGCRGAAPCPSRSPATPGPPDPAAAPAEAVDSGEMPDCHGQPGAEPQPAAWSRSSTPAVATTPAMMG